MPAPRGVGACVYVCPRTTLRQHKFFSTWAHICALRGQARRKTRYVCINRRVRVVVCCHWWVALVFCVCSVFERVVGLDARERALWACTPALLERWRPVPCLLSLSRSKCTPFSLTRASRARERERERISSTSKKIKINDPSSSGQRAPFGEPRSKFEVLAFALFSHSNFRALSLLRLVLTSAWGSLAASCLGILATAVVWAWLGGRNSACVFVRSRLLSAHVWGAACCRA